MKTRRWMNWAVSAWLLVSALPALAGVNSVTTFTIKGNKADPWKVYNLTGTGTFRTIKIQIDPGCLSLKIQTGYKGGYGNCDLYLRKGAQPTLTRYLRRRAGPTYKETMTILRPGKGNYYLKIHAKKNYRTNLKITIVYPLQSVYGPLQLTPGIVSELVGAWHAEYYGCLETLYYYADGTYYEDTVCAGTSLPTPGTWSATVTGRTSNVVSGMLTTTCPGGTYSTSYRIVNGNQLNHPPLEIIYLKVP